MILLNTKPVSSQSSRKWDQHCLKKNFTIKTLFKFLIRNNFSIHFSLSEVCLLDGLNTFFLIWTTYQLTVPKTNELDQNFNSNTNSNSNFIPPVNQKQKLNKKTNKIMKKKLRKKWEIMIHTCKGKKRSIFIQFFIPIWKSQNIKFHRKFWWS